LTVKVLYKASVRRDLKKIDQKGAERILREIRHVLGDNPGSGEALHGEFAGLYKLRIGEYRVIYALLQQDVLVLRIRHRSKAYERLVCRTLSSTKRLGHMIPYSPPSVNIAVAPYASFKSRFRDLHWNPRRPGRMSRPSAFSVPVTSRLLNLTSHNRL
jgi:mRNA interferase RelE/StbE